MRILVICQYYYPEPFRITDICEMLVSRGHEVFVVTGIPNYPAGRIYDEYRNGQKRDEIRNGVRIHRCFTISRRQGTLWRFFNYYSYVISSKRYISKLKDTFDLVFVNQLSPVMMASAGIKYKKKYCKKLILYCLDLWPESLLTGGIHHESMIYRLFNTVSEKIYQQADSILISSQLFEDHLVSRFGIDEDKIVHLPQYAEDIFDIVSCQPSVEKETMDLMFAGNIGAAQGVQTILKAAAELKDMSKLLFHIVGDGSELENCQKLAAGMGLKNVLFYGRQPVEKMPELYAIADAMLVTLNKDSFLSLTLPGKVQSYMAAGKPILGAANGETAFVIQDARCGFCAAAEDSAGLADKIRLFLAYGDKQSLSIYSRAYYDKYFTEQRFYRQLDSVFENLKTTSLSEEFVQ